MGVNLDVQLGNKFNQHSGLILTVASSKRIVATRCSRESRDEQSQGENEEKEVGKAAECVHDTLEKRNV